MNKSRAFKLPALPLLFAVGLLLPFFSRTVKQGVASGLTLCGETLIPSLFPFLWLGALIQAYLPAHAVRGAGAFRALFHLPAASAPIFLFSLIGGYPAGPMLCAAAHRNRRLSADEARALMLFCSNAGPAFSIVAVGEGMCGSKMTGILLFASSLLSTCIIGIIIGLLRHKKAISQPDESKKEAVRFSDALSAATDSAMRAMLSICAYVLLFGVLAAAIDSLPAGAQLHDLAAALLEVTGGCLRYRNAPVALAFLLNFGGFCVFFQIKRYLHETGTSSILFLSIKVLGGACSAAIYYGLSLLFAQAVPTLAAGTHVSAVSFSAPLSAALVLTFCVFILDNKKEKLFEN